MSLPSTTDNHTMETDLDQTLQPSDIRVVSNLPIWKELIESHKDSICQGPMPFERWYNLRTMRCAWPLLLLEEFNGEPAWLVVMFPFQTWHAF